ncbi:hypothetical protein E3U55_10445 [Filobacillus milosensis]|uniref:Uncharacterized protein n=1 Tax=Filobacillus milosensis TaxID=94137 RepID=A0A4Y8IIR4_9BACI|nr:hypothetical protein [Filobacillus milosensis]TFB19572.1 hypothetical protein E3U55_10445 [Filobacillus milosensis]
MIFRKIGLAAISLIIVLFYFYTEMNTYPSSKEAVENTELGIPVKKVLMINGVNIDSDHEYVLFSSEINGDAYYGFAMTKWAFSGWKAVDYVGGFHITTSNANGSYSYKESMKLVNGLIDRQVDRVMIGDRIANINPLPNSNLRVWYQFGISEEELESVRFLDKNDEEIR